MTQSRRLLFIAILLLATILRFYRLDGQSFWNDEGNSVRLAQRSLALVAAGAAGDIHPPGYYYLLWAWIRFTGDSEFAVRSLSAFMGLLLVAVTYALGHQLGHPARGLAASLLAAVSPFRVYYSQEARMYILVTLVGAAATYSFVRMVRWETGKLRNWDPTQPTSMFSNLPIYHFSYVLLTAAGLYTHYSYPVVIAVQNTVYAIWLLTTWRRGRIGARLLRWATVQLGALVFYAPWLPIAWPKMIGYGAISETQSPSHILSQAFRHYTLGPTAGQMSWTGWFLIGFGLLTVVGLVRQFSIRNSQLAIRLLPLLYALAPLAMMVALSFSRPAYRSKFFLVGTPAFHFICAYAIFPFHRPNGPITQPSDRRTLRLSRLYSAVASIFVTLAAIPSLHNYYHDPAFARDDYRGMARYIQAVARDGDAVLLNAPNQWEVFTYYYGDDASVYPLPRSRPPDEAATAAELETIVAGHRRIFALYWGVDESDPSRFVESWLEGHVYRAADGWHGGVRLVVYAVPQTTETPQRPLDLSLGDAVALRGYALAADAVEAGDILQLTLFWQAQGQPVERYKVFVQLLDSANHIVGQLDTEPGGNLLPTDTWQAGQTVTDRYGVLVQPGTPPGEHRLIVGMYSLSTGARLPVVQHGESLGDHAMLGLVEVARPPAPPPAQALPSQHRVDWSHEGLELLGYDLHKLGYAHQPDTPLHSGDALHVNLYWQAKKSIAADWALHLRLLDESGHEWAGLDAPLAGVGYPLSNWTAGEVVRAQFDLFVPGDAPPGRYRLEIAPVAPTSEKGPNWSLLPFYVK
jgi:4-amino-4-deoxy-L-arabinose transferase-like glycosyltransferase